MDVINQNDGGCPPSKKRKYMPETSLLQIFVDYVASQQPSIPTPEEIIECVEILQRENSSNVTSFQSAVKKKLHRLLPILLACNDDTNFTDSRGQTILHIFVKHFTSKKSFPRVNPYKDRDIVKILMKKGAFVDAVDMTNNTPIHYATANRRIDLVQLMLNNFTDVDAQSDSKCTVLHHLVRSYTEKPSDFVVEVIRALISKGADFRIPKNMHGWSALDLAIQNCSIRVLEVFDTSCANSERLLLRLCQNAAYWTDNYYEELKHLRRWMNLEKSVNDRTEKCNSTPLHYVAKHDAIEAVTMLLDAGADVNAKSVDGVTPLHLAVMEGHVDTAKYLVERGADLHARDAIFNFGLMHMAMFKGHEEVIDLLIELGLDAEDQGADGLTPLHMAAFVGNERSVDMLLNLGADVNCRTREQRWTPLHLIWSTSKSVALFVDADKQFSWVCQCFGTGSHVLQAKKEERANCVTLLLQAGANANARDAKFRTPLHSAASLPSVDHYETTVALLRHGARVDVKDADGRSPLMEAYEKDDVNNPTCLSDLLRYGVDLDDERLTWQSYNTISMLPRYLIQLQEIDMPISNSSLRLLAIVNLILPTQDARVRSFGENVKDRDDEIAKLKADYLVDGETSMYDFLHMNWRLRCRFAESVLALDLKREYPIYQVVIENSCRRAINEKVIRDEASLILKNLVEIDLPDICTEKIFSYVDMSDMATFIDSVRDDFVL